MVEHEIGALVVFGEEGIESAGMVVLTSVLWVFPSLLKIFCYAFPSSYLPH
jgi:hypothetical protein